MSGRHRTPSTNRCLTSAGALGLMLAAPLAVPVPAMAAQPSGFGLAPEESPPDDDTGDYLDRYRDQRRDARERDREQRRDENSGDRDKEERPRHRSSEDDRDGSSSRRSRAREAARSRDQESDTSSGDDDDSEDDSEDEDARWDELAECESSQNWDANTGNGYRGGLQFSEATWRAHGGRRYAPSPDQASREEQIEVAKDVQRDQGWSAWPSCSDQLGYT